MIRQLTRGTAIALGTMTFVLLAACGGTAGGSTATATPKATNSTTITLTDMKVDVSPQFTAGKYTFTIINKGALMHELLVFKSDLAQSKYPTVSSGNVNEEGAGISKVSDGDNLAAGASQTREIDLSVPGTYLFLCNLDGHYAAGMHTQVVTVS
jgi:uncharacterized cupredoxin-like copper-binding protein